MELMDYRMITSIVKDQDILQVHNTEGYSDSGFCQFHTYTSLDTADAVCISFRRLSCTAVDSVTMYRCICHSHCSCVAISSVYSPSCFRGSGISRCWPDPVSVTVKHREPLDLQSQKQSMLKPYAYIPGSQCICKHLQYQYMHSRQFCQVNFSLWKSLLTIYFSAFPAQNHIFTNYPSMH